MTRPLPPTPSPEGEGEPERENRTRPPVFFSPPLPPGEGSLLRNHLRRDGSEDIGEAEVAARVAIGQAGVVYA